MRSDWVRTFAAPGRHRMRLVCFPHAGGAATAYVRLARELHPDVHVLAVQYPGREDRVGEPSLTDVAHLAEAVADELVADERATDEQADRAGPYALFGHSLGALIAYETARRLVNRSVEPPKRLFLSGRGAPLVSGGGNALPALDDAGLRAHMVRLGGTDAAVLNHPDLAPLVLNAMRADYRAAQTYTWSPGPPLDIPTTVLIGADDDLVTAEHAAEWRHFTTARCDLRVLPGGHFYLDAQVAEVSRVIDLLSRSDVAPDQDGTPSRALRG
ncbi:thioesterase II family protein [Streptomyces sp. NPDC050548]|uniref:thioesterase II family protein n=1 Tax=Streptomyces sp. NPDC050548 TaxID=3365629 RepID=UPI00379E358D